MATTNLFSWKAMGYIGIAVTTLVFVNHRHNQNNIIRVLQVRCYMFNEDQKEYEWRRFEMKSKGVKSYKICEVKQKISEMLNLTIGDIGVDLESAVDDNSRIPADSLFPCQINITFTIKYFTGYDTKHYQTFTLKTHPMRVLYDIINEHVTFGQIVIGSLICKIHETSNCDHLLFYGYIRQFPGSIPLDIINLIVMYYVKYKDIDLRKTLCQNRIINGNELILCRDFGNPFFEYSKIENTTFTINVIKFFDQNPFKMEINTMVTGQDIIRKLGIDQDSVALMVNRYEISHDRLKEKIIDWGVNPGSTVTITRTHYF